jgi:hypothetical protein
MMLRMLMPVVARRLPSVVTAAVLMSLVATPARAQVGHTPTASPYRDQKIGQTLSILGGQLFIRRDPADVAPSAAPMFGARYDVGVGGPSALYFRYAMSPSERRSLLPNQPLATRLEGTPSVTTHIVDLGLDIALTGRKTWRNLMPSVTGGVGLASDFQNADAGGYKFGTKFTVTYGAALRYIPPGRISYRLDLTNFYWQYQYPDAYFVPTSDQTSVLSDTKQRNAWRGNWGVTAGLSWQLFK